MPFLPHCLGEVIAKDFHTLTLKNCKKTFRLCEPKENLSVDLIVNKTDSVFCFSIDKDRDRTKLKGDPVFPFFNPEVKYLCTKNDFILVYQKGSKIQVFLIELKSKNTDGYLRQLRAGKIAFQFIIERIKLCKPDFQDLNTENVIYKGILFSKREIPAKTTSVRPKQRKLDFKKVENFPFPIFHQTYDEVCYLSKFI